MARSHTPACLILIALLSGSSTQDVNDTSEHSTGVQIEPNDPHPVLRKGKNTLRLHYKIEDKLIPSGMLTIEE